MRTIEEIRLENYLTLVEELGEGVGDLQVSISLGISKVYAWQLRTGKRTAIDSKAARKFEVKADKPVGWMDTDFKLWPFPDIAPDRFLNLKSSQRYEIQGQVRGWIEKFEAELVEAELRRNGTSN